MNSFLNLSEILVCLKHKDSERTPSAYQAFHSPEMCNGGNNFEPINWAEKANAKESDLFKKDKTIFG